MSRNVAGLLTLMAILLGLALAVPSDATASGWAPQPSGSQTSAALNGVAFANANEGWAVGYNTSTSASVILATTDGGTSWSPQNTGASADISLLAVAFANANEGWAVGYNTSTSASVILATTDGGTSWSPQSSGALADTTLRAVDFANANDGWAVGYYNNGTDTFTSVVLATTDGGATWGPQSSGALGDTGLTGVSFASANDGWAVGWDVDTYGSVVLATTDGGTTWSPQTSGTLANTMLNAVSFANASDGWAVDNNGTILSTTDGGATWKTHNAGTTGDVALFAVTFANPSDGWAVGHNYSSDAGVVLATTDGGVTWKAENATADAYVNAVGFANASDGWTVGFTSTKTVDGGVIPNAGVILATTDGGVVTPKLALRLSGLTSGVLHLGRRLTIKGTVTPAYLAGGRVVLTVQRKQSSNRWVTIKTLTSTIGAGGAYSGTYRPARGGGYRMEATVPKTAANTAVTTSWRAFKVD